jgi:ketosteroid isomerase-like protein
VSDPASGKADGNAKDQAHPRAAGEAAPEDADLLRRFYESFNQRDLDAVLELCAPEVEVYKDPEVVEMVAALTPRGRERVAQYLRGWLESWDDYRARPLEFRTVGDEVIALIDLRARGKGSQFHIEEHMADVFNLRDGLITRLRLYVQPDVALGRAGPG